MNCGLPHPRGLAVHHRYLHASQPVAIHPGVLYVSGPPPPLRQEVVEPLAVTYVASHPNSGVVLQRLWPLNRDLLLRAMTALYQKDASNIARVLDVCQASAGGPGGRHAAPESCRALKLLRARRACRQRLSCWLQRLRCSCTEDSLTPVPAAHPAERQDPRQQAARASRF